MIEGFCVELTSNEVLAHLNDRVRWYESEADELGQQIRKALEKRPKSAGPIDDDDNGDHDHDLSSMRASRVKAAEFRFLANHVVLETKYRLDATDLEYLEMIERGRLFGGYNTRRRFRPRV